LARGRRKLASPAQDPKKAETCQAAQGGRFRIRRTRSTGASLFRRRCRSLSPTIPKQPRGSGRSSIPPPIAWAARTSTFSPANPCAASGCAQRPADGGDRNFERRLAVAKRVLANSRYYDVARAFGRIVAEANAAAGDGQTMIMTGGGPGIMEAANRGAFDAGAKTIGLNISLPREQFPNPYVSPDLCFSFHYFALRKMHFMQRAMALVAFPGGYGTLDELFEILTLSQTRKIRPMPIVLVGERHWRKAVDFDYLVDDGVIDPEDRELIWYAETAEEIWAGIQKWEREKEERFGAAE